MNYSGNNSNLSYHPASYYTNANSASSGLPISTSIPIRSPQASNNNYQNSIPRSTSTFQQKSFQHQQQQQQLQHSQHHGPKTATIIPIIQQQQQNHHQNPTYNNQKAQFAYNVAYQSQLQSGENYSRYNQPQQQQHQWHQQIQQQQPTPQNHQQQQQQQYTTKYATLTKPSSNSNKLSSSSNIPTFGNQLKQSKSQQQLLYSKSPPQTYSQQQQQPKLQPLSQPQPPPQPLLPQNLLNTLRTLFNILDDKKTGRIHVSEIESRWDNSNSNNNNNSSNSNNNNSLLNLDSNYLVSTLRALSKDSNGELDFISFCNGVKIVLGYDKSKTLEQRRSLDNLLSENEGRAGATVPGPKGALSSKLRPPSAPTVIPTSIPSPKGILIKPQSNLKSPNSWTKDQSKSINHSSSNSYLSKSPPTKSSNFVPYKSQLHQLQAIPPPAPPKPPRNSSVPAPVPIAPALPISTTSISKIQRLNKSTNDLLDSKVITTPSNNNSNSAPAPPVQSTTNTNPSKQSKKSSNIRRYTLNSPPVDANTLKQLKLLEEQKKGLQDIGKMLDEGGKINGVWIKNLEQAISEIVKRGELGKDKSANTNDTSTIGGDSSATLLPQPFLNHRLSTLQSSLSSFITLLTNPSATTTATLQSMDLFLPQKNHSPTQSLNSSSNPTNSIDDTTIRNTLHRLQAQNRQLTQEVSNASARIGQLEGEKMRLIKELFYKNSSNGDFLETSGIGHGNGNGQGGVYM